MPSRPVGARMRYPFFQESPPTASRISSTPRAVGDLAGTRFEILRPIVDEVIDAESAHLGVLGGGCRSNDVGAEVFGDLGRRNADTAAD